MSTGRSPGDRVDDVLTPSEGASDAVPRLGQVVLDARDCPALAEFYRRMFDLRYRPGDEPPADPSADDVDWLVLRQSDGGRALAFQQQPELRRSTWPDPDVPMQLHLDCTVDSRAALEAARARAEALGARLLADRSEDPEEPLYVLADPEGHPFCLFVA